MKNLTDYIPRIYYYVPPCPRCGSKKTGYCMKMNVTNKNWSEYEALKNGEIVRQKAEIPENNAFCCDCGHEWPQLIYSQFVSKERIKQEMEDRRIIDFLTAETQKREDARLKEKDEHAIRYTVKRFLGL